MVRGAGITEWPLIRGQFLLRSSFPARREWHVWGVRVTPSQRLRLMQDARVSGTPLKNLTPIRPASKRPLWDTCNAPDRAWTWAEMGHPQMQYAACTYGRAVTLATLILAELSPGENPPTPCAGSSTAQQISPPFNPQSYSAMRRNACTETQ